MGSRNLLQKRALGALYYIAVKVRLSALFWRRLRDPDYCPLFQKNNASKHDFCTQSRYSIEKDDMKFSKFLDSGIESIIHFGTVLLEIDSNDNALEHSNVECEFKNQPIFASKLSKEEF